MCLFLLVSCSKDSPEPQEPYIGDGYIRGNFGGEHLNYTQTFETFPGGDTTANQFNPNINGGQLVLMRKGNYPDQRTMYVDIFNVDLEKMPIPSEISSSQPLQVNQGYTVYGLIGITDYSSMPQDMIIGGPKDSYNYGGSTSDEVIIRVTSKKNDILEGTFEGTVRTPSGLVREVTDGEFRIKILRVKKR